MREALTALTVLSQDSGDKGCIAVISRYKIVVAQKWTAKKEYYSKLAMCTHEKFCTFISDSTKVYLQHFWIYSTCCLD